jgi:hypothetical protein
MAHHLPVRPASALHFVHDQKNAVTVADRGATRAGSSWARPRIRLRLNRFDEDRRNLFGRQNRLEEFLFDKASAAQR